MKVWLHAVLYVIFFVSQFLVFSAALILAAGWMSTAVNPFGFASLTLVTYSLAAVAIIGWKDNPKFSVKEYFLVWRSKIIAIAVCYIILFIFT